MALTLDPALVAAMESNSRRPICTLMSEPAVGGMPITTSALLSGVDGEGQAAAVGLTSGRLVVASYRSQVVTLRVSDAAGAAFAVYEWAYPLGTTMAGLAVAEGGTDQALLYALTSALQINCRAVNLADGSVAASSTVSLAAGLYAGLAVLRLADESYLMAYARQADGASALYTRGSADGLAWGTESAAATGGLDGARLLRQPALLQDADGLVQLWFDYVDSMGTNGEELRNVYRSESEDAGASFGTALKVTNYAGYLESATDPVAVVRGAATATVVFAQEAGSLQMGSDSLGWTDNGDEVGNMHFDPLGRFLYVTAVPTWVGTKVLSGVMKIDVDTWEVVRAWDDASTPALFPAFFTAHVWWDKWWGEGHLVPVGLFAGMLLQLIDGEADTVTTYAFADYLDYDTHQNVVHGIPLDCGLWAARVRDGRLYLMFGDTYVYDQTLIIGYIELSDVGPEYTFHVLIDEVNQLGVDGWLSGQEQLVAAREDGFLDICPDEGLVILTAPSSLLNDWRGFTRIWTLAGGELVKYYIHDFYDAYPYNGLRQVLLKNGVLYGGFAYSQDVDEAERRGVCAINLTTDVISYHRPGYATYNDYGLRDAVDLGGDEILWATGSGPALWNIVTDVWTLYDNASVPGLTPGGVDGSALVAYDPAQEMILAGGRGLSGWHGVIGVFREGLVQRLYYMDGVKEQGWTYTPPAMAVIGARDFAPVAAVDGEGALFLFWNTKKVDQSELRWAKEAAPFDLAPLLVAGEELVVERRIDGAPGRLTCILGSGQLFDPYNADSLWSQHVRKGRRLTLHLGERLDGSDYLVGQGVFYVTQVQIQYRLGLVPRARVVAEDVRSQWAAAEIVATPFYAGLPEDALADLVTRYGGLTLEQVDLPAFAGGFNLDANWIDTNLDEAVSQVCARFGYYPRIDAIGAFTVRAVAQDNPVNHAYSDTATLIEFGPDDSYSDMTNRVVVEGEERDFTEVLHDEERLASLSGTFGWWGGTEDFNVYYSTDNSRRARFPRLAVKNSAASIGFELSGGVEEGISEVDQEDQFCVVRVDAPNLAPLLLAGLGTYFGGNKIGDWLNTKMNNTIPFGRWIESFGLALCVSVLGSVVNYQYEVWGRPVGKVRRSIQGQADDVAHQAELGWEVERRLEGWLCYSVAACQQVAEWELMVARLQRRRAILTKVADLRDEDGDTLQLPHPYTGQVLTLYVTDLTRRFKPAPPGGEGYLLDEIEGWVL